MTGLEGFSDWALALLPRLFLYPGGVWMLAALIGLRFVSGGLASIKPLAVVGDLVKASLPALAVAWVTLSLVPLPGASPLAEPVDTLVLVSLVLVSLTLDGESEFGATLRAEWVSVAMAVAVLASILQGHALLGHEPALDISGLLSTLAILTGLAISASTVTRNLAGAVRWLAWLGLGYMPLLVWWAQPQAASIVWTSLIYVGSIAVFTLVGRLIARYVRRWEVKATSVACGLATLALLVAVLGN